MDDLLTFAIMVVFAFLLLSHVDRKLMARNQRKRKSKVHNRNMHAVH